MSDLISRQAVLDVIGKMARPQGDGTSIYDEGNFIHNETLADIHQAVCDLPSAEKTGHCKDCKWWKDSDGTYRRGVRAESTCPFNTKEVYEGNAYCYKFEPYKAESEDCN